MSASRGFPEALISLVADLQTRLDFGQSEDQFLLPRASLISPGGAAPEVYRRSYEALLSDAPGLPYTMLLPGYHSYRDHVNARLVCCLGTNIHVLEDVRGQVKSACYPIEQISYVETGKVLLYSWVQLHGQNADGDAVVAEFRFNTVTDYVVNPIVEWIRSATPVQDRDGLTAGRDDFDYLSKTNIKLVNYSRRSIPPGDRVVQHIYQPEIRVEVLRLLGFPLFQKRANPHMAILTDKELILIQDGDFKRSGKNAVYAGIWHYIPLDKIISISLAGTIDNLLTMSISLPADGRIDCLFSPSLRPELDMLLSRCKAVPGNRT